MYNPCETVDTSFYSFVYIQLPTWQNQPETEKMAELKVDDEKSGAERSGRVKETRIHTTGQWRDHIQAGPQSLVQIKTEFSMYVCMYVKNTCKCFIFSQR